MHDVHTKLGIIHPSPRQMAVPNNLMKWLSASWDLPLPEVCRSRKMVMLLKWVCILPVWIGGLVGMLFVVMGCLGCMHCLTVLVGRGCLDVEPMLEVGMLVEVDVERDHLVLAG